MSGRKDWSALSSLAQQWSLEDEEEQRREHRRRHRNLSSTTDDDELPQLAQDRGRPSSVRLPSVEEAGGPKSPSPASPGEKEDIQAVPRTRQERRQRRQLVEVSQAPVRERLEAEERRDSSGPGQAEQQPLTPKKEVGVPPRRRLSREQRGPWAQEKESPLRGEPGGGQKGVSESPPGSGKKPSAPEEVAALEKRPSSQAASSSESTSLSEKVVVSEKKKTIIEKIGISEKLLTPGKTSSSERSLVSEKTLLFEKSSTSETKLVPKRALGSKQPKPREKPQPQEQPKPWENPQPQEQPKPPEKPQPGEQPKPREKPQPQEQPKPPEEPQPREQPKPREKPQPQEQPKPRGKSQPGEQPKSQEKPQSQEQPQAQEQPQPRKEPQAQVQLQAQEQTAAGGSQKATSLPGKNQLSSAEAGTCHPSPRTARLPPITLKVRIPRKEEEEGTSSSPRATYSSSLRRSSPRTISFRISPRINSSEATLTRSASVRLPVKLGEKLERYQSAVQRSESIKAVSSSRTEFFVAPVGVASKRDLFEKERAGLGRAESASGLKENLKLSGVVTSKLNLWISRTQESREEDPQEAQRELATTQRTPERKKAGSSLDAEA